MTFADDLAVGQEVERKVLKKIQTKYPLSFIIDGCVKAYDIFIPEISKGIEVKYDIKCQETGNVCVEIECNNVDSALMTTRADMWVFHTGGDRYWWVKPERLKDLIIKHNPKINTFIPKGSTSPVKAFLIKEELLATYAES
jgi:hypothetical protein